ncbi:MAG TPA: class I SAM-dependent methyltransferase [Chloroflexota bacterium]|nr:class I SAM-dependent methyltransferase [Chloroflexota bacterium]HUM67799.1 class I SAM-dependent methyltransferase [Chloroflexota bacterium]
MSEQVITKGIEYVCCNLCGADDTAVRYQIPVRDDQLGDYGQDIWNIVQCRRCGLIYTNPRPDKAALSAYYTFANEWDYQFVQDWFIENADLQRPTWQRYLRVMRQYAPSGKLLDVGCGAGTFLLEAQQAGYDVCGQEVSPYFAEYGRAAHHLHIYEGELDSLNLASNSFDITTAFDVIEHHPDPQQLLQQMYDLLKPGGIIVLSTHDIGNFYARRYGDRWRYLNPVGHLVYFTRQTLQTMLHQVGFQVLQVGGIHTIDVGQTAVARNKIVQFGRVILLRALIIGLYKPITRRIPRLTHWQIQHGNATLNHKKLLLRVGSQIVMDDDMVVLAQK